ncbi:MULTISPECIES: hypothetical protein [Gracilibacillus]|uniref:hypothetical protein n=1 Tax=Gracilibacillus TaxID=74385 RepID=UPI00082406C7|nr:MULTISPECIES: hypothetical protein [Gracilibacillus]
MKLSNFILHNDILLVHADINGNDYIFTVKWRTFTNKKGGDWELKSYLNNSNGKRDLTEQQLQKFIDRINPQWDWDNDQKHISDALKND